MAAPTHRLISRRSLLAGAAVAVPATAVLAVSGSRLDADSALHFPFMEARLAGALVGSVGVNTHLNFMSSVYGHTDRVVEVVADLGVRHVRDRIAPLTGTRRGFAALSHLGIRIQGICGAYGDHQSMAEVMGEVVGRYPDPFAVFSAFEGINEPNTSHHPWVAETRAKTRELHQQRGAHHLAGIPIVAPALARVVTGGTEGHDTHAQAAHLGDLRKYTDLGNIHVYPRMQTPGLDIDRFKRWQRMVTGAERIVCTEGGYFTAMNYRGDAFPTPEDVCAVYLPRLVMENWIRGIERFFVYELLDDYDPSGSDRESSFGLVHVNSPRSSARWTPKPHYRALRNFLAILGDAGHGDAPQGMRVRVSGIPGLRKALVSKRDGSHWLLLWRGIACYDPVTREHLSWHTKTATLDFPARHRVRVYHPTSSGSPVRSYDRARSVRIPVGAELVIARID